MTRQVTLLVPELAARPLVGSACCVVPAAEAIEQTLGQWAGVEAVRIDDAAGRVEVSVDPERGPAPADLVWSLRMLGLEATAA